MANTVSVRLRVNGVDHEPVPVRASGVEAALRGGVLDPASIEQAASHAADGTDPPGDLGASSDYKRHLARVLCARALKEAAGVT
jgi:aerobic carbon-monoxide dehydrogenase medium subunit